MRLLLAIVALGLVIQAGAGIVMPTWQLTGDAPSTNPPAAPTSFRATQYTNRVQLAWTATAPFVMVLRARYATNYHAWEGYAPIAVVPGFVGTFTDVENFSVPPPEGEITSITKSGPSAILTLSVPVGRNYYLDWSTDLISWTLFPVQIRPSTAPVVYPTQIAFNKSFFDIGSPYDKSDYHYLIIGIAFVNNSDTQAYAGKTTPLFQIGINQLPRYYGSKWTFLTNWTTVN